MAASKQFDAFFDNGLNSPFAEGADMYSYFIIRGNTFKSKNLFHPMQEKKTSDEKTKLRSRGAHYVYIQTYISCEGQDTDKHGMELVVGE